MLYHSRLPTAVFAALPTYAAATQRGIEYSLMRSLEILNLLPELPTCITSPETVFLTLQEAR